MQTTDIEIAGAGYMVAPGTYRRGQDGTPEGRTGRVVVRDFFGGQHRALQLERDRGWDGHAVGPAYDGQGVEPWPAWASWTDAALKADGSTVTAAKRVPHLVVGERAYIAVGRYLYKSVTLATGSWANWTRAWDAGAGKSITGLAQYQGNVAVLLGTSGDIQVYDIVTGTASALQSGEQGVLGVGYAGRLVYAEPGTLGNCTDTLRMTTGGGIDTRALDAPIVQMALFRGKVAIATRQSLWLLGGKSDPTTAKWLSDPEPFFTSGIWSADDDFRFLLSHGGKLYTWLANEVMEWNPNEGGKQGWRATGIRGNNCYGATVAGGYLIVCVQARDGRSELWAFDGSGWWLMNRVTSAEQCWPAYVGGAGNQEICVFRNGNASVVYELYRLIYRDAMLTAYRSDAAATYWQSSLLDAGERDKAKAWRKIGATFAVPENRGNQASASPVTLSLSYSLDGGKTLTTAATKLVSDPATRVVELDAALGSSAAVSRWIQLRVQWSGVADWAPVLTGVWAEYELLDNPARRRRWAFKVHARDGTVQRDGGVAPRDGRQLAADLWAAWANGQTVTFKDVDYDVTGQVASVRIVGIGEEIAKPADAGRWGESVLALTLVEV